MKRYVSAFLVLVLLIVTFAGFFPCLKNGFVNYDDNVLVTENSRITELSLKSIAGFFTSPYAGLYHPLVLVSYAVEYHFAGYNPFVYHLNNLLLHLANTALVFWFIYLLGANYFVAFVTALLFALHPMHVESVAWISERKDVLYSFFYIFSLVFYVIFIKNGNRRYYYYAAAAFALSLLSKPMAFTLPLVFILLDYFVNNKTIRQAVKNKIPLLAVSFAAAFGSVFAQHSIKDIVHLNTAAFLRAANSLMFYIAKLSFPVNLSCLYIDSEILFSWMGPQTFAYIILVLIVIVFLLRKKEYRKTMFFGVMFFLVTVFPVLQFITSGRGVPADRYTYIPSIGIFFMLASLVNIFYLKESRYNAVKRALLIFVLVFIVSSCFVLTQKRCYVWKDGVSLWNDAIKNYPDFASAYNNRGLAYSRKKQYDDAINDYTAAINKKPGFAKAYNSRANAYARKKDYKNAAADYNKALRLDKNFTDAYYNRANMHENLASYDKALSDYSQAIALRDDFADAYFARGNVYSIKKEYLKAVGDYTKVIELDPGFSGIFNNRGSSYFALGENERALSDFNKAIELNSNLAQAYYNRGVIYFARGQYNLAISDFNKTIRINPNFAPAYYNREAAYKMNGK